MMPLWWLGKTQTRTFDVTESKWSNESVEHVFPLKPATYNSQAKSCTESIHNLFFVYSFNGSTFIRLFSPIDLDLTELRAKK
jgi:hypothetical protein